METTNKNYPTKEAHEKYLEYQREYYKKNKNYFKARDLMRAFISPEKIKARRHSRKLFKTLPNGFERHHFSYNEQDWSNILILTKSEHSRVHQELEYCNVSKYFKYDGKLLTNFFDHFKAVKEILDGKLEFYDNIQL